MVAPPESKSRNLTFNGNWTAVARVKANSRPSGKRKTGARFCPAFLKARRSGLLSQLQFGTETLGLKIISRSQANFARHTPIILMRRNTEFETGRAAVARPRAKQSDESPQARLRKGYCLRCMPTLKSSPT